ncbi:adenylate/guanylate cyclase domain-containing protein [Alphaproteobacteria bacterium]|nr:adenylate/guanylate cyclase domain-containing protein [Alphaproteobacteria bacterium]
MNRRLVTIFALDVVNFSKLMGQDEVKTLQNLGSARELIDQNIDEYEGRIFNTAGDSVLAEFFSPVKALECAVKIQNLTKLKNNDLAENDKMDFRIGINIGDVLVQEGNLFGDAVNIAARLEAQSISGGICISQGVFDMVNMKVKVSYEDAGELELKNIEKPIKAYNVLKCRGAQRGIISADNKPKIDISQKEPGSLAILLFKNLSNDEEQSYFCEGFSEDLVSALSRYRKLLVISSNASFSYASKEKTHSEIGIELGVRYLLEGKVRKLGNKIRISASLLSTENAETLWSDNFDTNLDEIFDVQDSLVETIVSTIVGNVERDEIKKISNIKPENLKAYDLVLQGLEYHRRSSVSAENNKKALRLFTQATQTDPNYARAFAWKTCSLANNAEWFQDEMPDNWMQEAFASVNKAMELDPNDSEAHRIMGAIKLMFEGDMETALFHHEKAIEICPSDTYHIARYAILLCYLGDPKKGLEQIEKAMRIDPFCSELVLETLGMCHYLLGDFEQAISSFKKMQIDTRTSLFYKAASHKMIKDDERAKDALKAAFSESGMSIEKFITTQFFQNEAIKNNLSTTLADI